MKCDHGCEMESTQLPSGGWMGGVGHCRCCRSSYGYINSSTYGEEGLIQSKTYPSDLCQACGGNRIDYVHPDYERIEEESAELPGWTVVRFQKKAN